jgi:hypothetical protein
MVMWVMWYLVLVRLEIVLVSVQDRLRNRFGRTRWYSKVMRLKWKLDSVSLEILLILMQDRCTFCAKRTIGSEIVLDTPDGTAR